MQNDLDNFEVWKKLKDEDLASIGISSLGARKMLLSVFSSDDAIGGGQEMAHVAGLPDGSDVDKYANKGPEITIKNPSDGEVSSGNTMSGSSKAVIAVLIGAAVLLIFWLSGGFYHVGEMNRTINRGVRNQGAESAYQAAVSYFRSLPSVPNDAEFDSFSEVSVEDFGNEMYRFRFSYAYSENLGSGREMTRTRNCMAVASRDSSNSWRLGDHYPTE